VVFHLGLESVEGKMLCLLLQIYKKIELLALKDL
jgi:hypothetical protein